MNLADGMMPAPYRRPRGSLFLAASLLLHLALLTAWPQPQRLHFGDASARGMTVVLQPPSQASRSAQTAPQTKTHPPQKSAATKRRAQPPPRKSPPVIATAGRTAVRPVSHTTAATVTPPSVVKSKPRAQSTAQVKPETTAGSATHNRAALRSRLTARVGIELARYYHYPPQAVRRGWQGTVILGFRVNPHGHIEAIHVARSSGYSLLDRSAIGALRQVRLGPQEAGLTAQNLDLKLPVIYRLEAP